MKRFWYALMVAVLVTTGHAGNTVAQTPEAAYSGETEQVTIDLTISGYSVVTKIDENSCHFGIPSIVESPEIQITTPEGHGVSTRPLGIGEWTVDDEWGYCNESLEVDIPAASSFTLTFAPYFVEDVSESDVVNGVLELDLHRDKDDPFPISPYPTGGPLEGTENILVVGHLELRGEPFEDFATMPLLGCMGLGGYQDIQAGMQITIKDEYGKIIGLAELMPDEAYGSTENCLFYFTAEIPVSEFYTFESGRRGSITYSHNDLQDSDWTITLTLGR